MPVNLNYNEIGPLHAYGLPIIIVHGVLGSSSNWNSIAKSLGDTFKVITVDLRNHGDSPHAESMSYQEMAEDIKQLMETLSIPKATIMGHSMGGKAAMTFAQMFPEFVKHLIVVDIAPTTYPISYEHQINAMLQLDLENISSRQEADTALEKDIPDTEVRQFLLQNLKSVDGQYQWRLNLTAIQKAAAQISGFPADLDASESSYPVLLIGGENSEYFQKEHVNAAVALFPTAHVVAMSNAGHWLHIEKAEQFSDLIADYVSRA